MSAVATADRVNIGSGRFPLDGWLNVDLTCPADVQGDFREMEFEALSHVNMSHLLEHIPWRETENVLRLVRSWMRPLGQLQVEVPDMEAVMARGCRHPLWFKYVYGDQSTDGEFHQAGFTAEMLKSALLAAGFRAVHVSRFESNHKGREGMPCLSGRAVA